MGQDLPLHLTLPLYFCFFFFLLLFFPPTFPIFLKYYISLLFIPYSFLPPPYPPQSLTLPTIIKSSQDGWDRFPHLHLSLPAISLIHLHNLSGISSFIHLIICLFSRQFGSDRQSVVPVQSFFLKTGGLSRPGGCNPAGPPTNPIR